VRRLAAWISAAAISCCGFAPTAHSQTVNVSTVATEEAVYIALLQSGGPFPWSDLGFTATAFVNPGALQIATGGATQFNLTSSFTSGEVVNPGSAFDLSYASAWTGQFKSNLAAVGSLNSQLVYNIGPISGSQNIVNVSLVVPGTPQASLTSSLNSGSPSTVGVSASKNGPGVGATIGLAAQACAGPVCITAASATLTYSVGTEVQQSITAKPTVQYGDLVWESTTPTYSASDHPVFVSGSGGSIANALAAPAGATNGEKFYFNVLPTVALVMPVSNDADVALPMSITASWEIFGAGGSRSWPLGNLYTLGADGTFNFDPQFYGKNFYSLPLTYNAPVCIPLGCTDATLTVGGSGGNPVTTPNGGEPGDTGPCGGSSINCVINIPSSGTKGGYGNVPTSPLFPGDPSKNPICGPAGTSYAGYCINKPPTVTQNRGVPEPDTVALLVAGALGAVLTPRRRRLRA
jgi:hypothetical protein